MTLDKGFDVVVVRKSGPLSSLRIKGWWVYLVVGVVALLAPVLLSGAYLLYRHNQALQDILDETRLLSLRAERLESLVQEQETRDILASQPDERTPQDRTRSKASATADAALVEDARRETAALDRKAAEVALAGEPTASDRISLRNVEQKMESGDLVVSFELINPREFNDQAMGYITVVARGVRQSKPWIEAWPPMRLTALGRPQNYRRGTPFSVQRYRKVKARITAVGDKKFERLEVVIYNRQGDLIMVHSEPVDLGQASKNQSSGRDEG